MSYCDKVTNFKNFKRLQSEFEKSEAVHTGNALFSIRPQHSITRREDHIGFAVLGLVICLNLRFSPYHALLYRWG
jgi:hypothetical protein